VSSLDRTFERLASGLRINRASDDAAGLAVSSDLNARSRVYTQGVRNLNDGQSMLSIADSTIDQLSGIVTHLQELAEQAANGTYSNKQRSVIDAEAQSLSKEYFRVSRSAEFNGLRIFDGSLADGIRFQGGYGTDGSLKSTLGGALGTGSFGTGTSYATEDYASNATTLGDLNGDGILDLASAGRSDTNNGYATVRLGRGDGSFGTATSYATEDYESRALTLGDLNGDGILDLGTAGYILPNSNDGYATVRLGRGDGSFGTGTSYATEGSRSYALAFGDLNGNGVLDLVTAGFNDIFDGYATIRTDIARDGVAPLLPFSLRTQADARQAIPVLDRKLSQLSQQRGVIGAFQSRLTSAISTLHATRENYSAAEGRIKDTDVASDAGSLVRQQILQQAAAAVLAQANQAPALALTLLRSG
jgi:flagellin